jgi:hypothetical protein
MDIKEQKFIAEAIRVAEAVRKEGADPLGYNHPCWRLVIAADAYYASFDSPVNPPLAVKRAIILKFIDRPAIGAAVLSTLGYEGLSHYYFFTHAGMYHGVEPDGHIHT